MITGILLGDSLLKNNQWQIKKFRGKPLLKYPLDALIESNLEQIILVLGRNYHKILNKINIPKDRVRILMNRHFDRGFSTYLKTAINMISPKTKAILLAKGEYPFLKASLINRLIDYFNKEDSGIIIPTYNQKEGQPLIYGHKYFNIIKKLKNDDIGESIVMKYFNEVFRVEVKNPGVIKGINSIEELESLDSIEIDYKEKEASLKDREREDEIIIPDLEEIEDIQQDMTTNTLEITDMTKEPKG